MNTQPNELQMSDVIDFLNRSEKEAWRYADELEQERKRLHEVNRMLVDSVVLALDALNSFDPYDGDQLWSSSADEEEIDFVITKLRGALAKAKEQA